MADIVTDGGFEAGSLLHQYGAGAGRSTEQADEGIYSLKLPRLAGQLTGGLWSQQCPAVIGQTYQISMRVYGLAAFGQPLECRVDPGDGNIILHGSFTDFVDWTTWDSGTFVAVGTTITLNLENASPLNGRIWYVDSISATGVASVALLGKWRAIDAALDVLAGINGPAGGYHNNLGSRVYTREFTPVERPEVLRPYVCMPLTEESETIDYPGGRGARRVWRLRLYAYFDENIDTSPDMAATAENAAEFSDDVLKAFLLSPKLSGNVLDCAVVAVDSVVGVLGDFGVVTADLRFEQHVTAGELGP